jgi:uncharacterized protein YbjQ (UPF0145 family)
MSETAEAASTRLVETAQDLGATSVVNIRFQTTTTMNRLIVGMHCSVLCYGTAVIDREEDYSYCSVSDQIYGAIPNPPKTS